MKQVAHYKMTEQELRGQVEALQAQVAAMGHNVANTRLIANKLTEENGALAEALGQSTAARGKQADTIARLERENADLRKQLDALQGCRRVLLTLTDRGDAGDGYCIDDGAYESGALWVRELRAAG